MKIKETFKLILKVFERLLYYIILIPLVFVFLTIVWQIAFYPDKIPNIIGYKMFIVFDEYMDDSIKNGDLVFIKNTNPDLLEVNQVAAFRNGKNTVTIHKILSIDEQDGSRRFTMNTLPNETLDTKYVSDYRIEGLVVHRIPRLGAIIYFLQQPLVALGIETVIILFGIIAVQIAGKLDERDLKKESSPNY